MTMSRLSSNSLLGVVSTAVASGTTGSPTTDTSSRPGKTVYVWSGNGSVTISRAGFVEYLLLGGGGAEGLNGSGYSGGGGGQVHQGWLYLVEGTYTITVGAATAATANTQNGVNGNPSSISGTGVSITAQAGGGGTNSTIWQGPRGGGFNQWGAGAGGPGGASQGAGITSSITGSSVTYGQGNSAAQKGNPSTSGAGRCILVFG